MQAEGVTTARAPWARGMWESSCQKCFTWPGEVARTRLSDILATTDRRTSSWPLLRNAPVVLSETNEAEQIVIIVRRGVRHLAGSSNNQQRSQTVLLISALFDRDGMQSKVKKQIYDRLWLEYEQFRGWSRER